MRDDCIYCKYCGKLAGINIDTPLCYPCLRILFNIQDENGVDLDDAERLYVNDLLEKALEEIP